jgi:C4-dicarboxylate-specific signal transduction histidine kinase
LGEAQQFARVNRLMLMGEMTASIAHEVSQPLTGIVANAGTCQRYLAAPVPDLAEVRQHLEFIARDGRRAADIIARVRQLVKRAPPRAEPLDLNETLRETIALADRQLREHEVVLRTELTEGLPWVRADRIQLQQVILNLVVNAAEAMSEADGARELLVRTAAGNTDDLILEVLDSGPGIAPSQADHLFTSFHSTKPDGMGMGLSISRLIIESHGGQLTASANVPRGAAFRFTLPLSGPEAFDA